MDTNRDWIHWGGAWFESWWRVFYFLIRSCSGIPVGQEQSDTAASSKCFCSHPSLAERRSQSHRHVASISLYSLRPGELNSLLYCTVLFSNCAVKLKGVVVVFYHVPEHTEYYQEQRTRLTLCVLHVWKGNLILHVRKWLLTDSVCLPEVFPGLVGHQVTGPAVRDLMSDHLKDEQHVNMYEHACNVTDDVSTGWEELYSRWTEIYLLPENTHDTADHKSHHNWLIWFWRSHSVCTTCIRTSRVGVAKVRQGFSIPP